EQARAMEATLPGTEATALRAFEKWDWIGPGVIIGTNLSDYILKCPTRWELFRQLLQHAGDRIAGFGEFVPLDYLAVHVNTPTAYFTKAQPTRRYLNCIGRMCMLLT